VGFQVVEDDVGQFLRGMSGGIEMDFGVERRFVGIVDAGEALDLASPRFFVEPFGVSRLAHLKRSIHEDLDEISRFHGSPDAVAVDAVGTDKSGDGDDARFAEELGHGSNPADILLAILGRKSQPEALGEFFPMPFPQHGGAGVQTVADVIAVKDKTVVSQRVESMVDEIGERAFPGAAQASKPENATLVAVQSFPLFARDGMFVPEDLGLACAHGFPLNVPTNIRWVETSRTSLGV